MIIKFVNLEGFRGEKLLRLNPLSSPIVFALIQSLKCCVSWRHLSDCIAVIDLPLEKGMRVCLYICICVLRWSFRQIP